MKGRIPGLVVLLFVGVGMIAAVQYGADLPLVARSIVGGLSGLGLFSIVATLFLNLRNSRRPKS
jgi:hypothetical protein